MAKKAQPTKVAEEADEGLDVNLAKFLSTKAVFQRFSIWIVGDSPLIVHAWSEKAKREMLSKQVKAIRRAGREIRDPNAEFLSSLYHLDDGYGFPATAIKKCMLTSAHKDKGIPRETVMRSLWIDAPFVTVQAAHAGAVCNLPIVRIYGSEPEMREDMVRIGAGLRKTANLAYRAQFLTWAVRVRGRLNRSVINEEVLEYLVTESGQACGIGDWRNEKSGVFGAFHLASPEEAKAWEAYASGKGPLPEAQYAEVA